MKLLIEILLNISGWNIMSNYKMGYTLIETILVIAIVFILGGITITLSIESINDYNLSLSNCYYEDKFDNALLKIPPDKSFAINFSKILSFVKESIT